MNRVFGIGARLAVHEAEQAYRQKKRDEREQQRLQMKQERQNQQMQLKQERQDQRMQQRLQNQQNKQNKQNHHNQQDQQDEQHLMDQQYQHNQQFPQDQQYQQHPPPSLEPPPIPYASKPGYGASPAHTPSPAPPPSAPHRTAYWQPDLHHGPVSAVFRHETGQTGWGNNEAQNYTSRDANSFLSPRGLVIRAIAASALPDGEKHTSARLTSHATLGRDRGALSVRITAPIATGIWPAFWLLPQDPFVWPNDGEVDIMETWDGDGVNHSCLHWGHYNGEDWDKHRVQETGLSRAIEGRGVVFEFAWDEQGRVVWYVDGRAVMKANMPRGARMLREFRLIINVAMGGNVCKGHMPRDGMYEMVVSELAMWDAPVRGWHGFETDWRETREGHP